MKPLLPCLLIVALASCMPSSRAAQISREASKLVPVMVSEGVLTIPTYQSPGRDMNPPLFRNSTLIGLYPFTTYEMPYKPGGPDSPSPLIRAKSYYMFGQIDQYDGHPQEARKMMAEAVQIKPDYIGPRY